MLLSNLMDIQKDIYTVKLFFSSLRIQPGQTFWLFCTSELISHPFWPNGLCLPSSTPPLSSLALNLDIHKQKLAFWLICKTYTFCNTPSPIQSRNIKTIFMGVFHSWSRTWIFEMGIGVLPIGCWSAYHPEPLKNLHTLTFVRTFPQTLQSNLTIIHPDNTAGLFNWRV